MRLAQGVVVYVCCLLLGLTPELTFAAESGFVLVEPLQSDFLSDELQELVEGWAPVLVVVHVLLSLLALTAVHQANLGASGHEVKPDVWGGALYRKW